jgi:hypothetical protein
MLTSAAEAFSYSFLGLPLQRERVNRGTEAVELHLGLAYR